MADIKLESDYWETSGIRDIAQNKTQRQINAELQGSLTSEATARQNADSALQGSLNSEVTARENADTAIQGAIASVETNWQSASRTFAVGEYIYSTTSGELYKITTAVPQGTSFEGHVTLTTIGDVLSSELIDISENITLTIQNVSHTLYCRRWGKNVWLNIFTGTPQTLTQEGGWVSVGTLSPNYCPPTNLLITTKFNDTTVQIRIQTNGVISFAGIPAIANAYVVFSINYIVN